MSNCFLTSFCKFPKIHKKKENSPTKFMPNNVLNQMNKENLL